MKAIATTEKRMQTSTKWRSARFRDAMVDLGGEDDGMQLRTAAGHGLIEQAIAMLAAIPRHGAVDIGLRQARRA